jgi:hypothetical protein
MSQNGCNVIRVWAEQGDQNTTGDYYLEKPVGIYQANQTARLDELFNACDTYGVYVEICPYDTYNVKANWAQFCYNTANGGPCASYTALINTAAGRQAIKNKIQWMYNRWGSHPSFFLWTFNEIDQLDTASADQVTFANDVGGFINSIDPYHPFSISWTGSGAGNAAVCGLATDEAADIHFYGAISGTGGVAKENETAVTRDGGYLNFNKPLVLSEWGVSRQANTDHLVNAILWGGIGIGSSGSGLVWTDKYQYGNFTPSQYAIANNLRSFCNTVNWAGFMDNHHSSTTELTSSSHGVSVFGCQNATQAIVLLVASATGSTATTVTLNGLANGTYTVDQWRTYGGALYASTQVTCTNNKITFASAALTGIQALYIH